MGWILLGPCSWLGTTWPYKCRRDGGWVGGCRGKMSSHRKVTVWLATWRNWVWLYGNYRSRNIRSWTRVCIGCRCGRLWQGYKIKTTILYLRKWFEPRSSIPWLKKIIWVIGFLRRTVVSNWRFDNLCGSHLQSQVVVLVSGKFKNLGERFVWSIDRVAIGKYVVWLAVKTCAEIGYANRWIVKWIINKVLLFPVE